MRNVCVSILSAADTSDQNGAAVNVNQIVSASFGALFGDATAEGLVKIQCSYDQPPGGNLASFTPSTSSWLDIPNATVNVTAGACAPIVIANMCFFWIRAVWDRSSGGSTTVNVKMNALSI